MSNYNKNHEIVIDTGMRIRNEMVKYEVYNLIVTSTVFKCLFFKKNHEIDRGKSTPKRAKSNFFE